ncbi:MAG: L-threonine 3-dehydrogenase [Elusimicrobia bacterium]|nr:L-threonine 3-dehydrogenase [Elusimicrobiota bacterium]
MQALCKSSSRAGVDLVTSEPPSIAKDELLLKVRRASICGSDMTLYHWNSWAPGRIKTPLIFGHEFCGTVVETGPEVREVSKGDFVSVESHIFCGECVPCRNDQKHVCQNLQIIGIDRQGGFAEYARVPARCAWKHSDAALQDIGSLMEPLGNAVYATLIEPVEDQTVLVLGCGPQGLFAIQVARASRARRVIAVEGAPLRKRLAAQMGADIVLDPADPDLASRIRKETQGAGADVVLEMSGSPAAIHLGFSALRNGGRFTAFGIPPGELKVRWAQDIVFRGLRIHGVAGRLIFKTWETMDRLLRSKAIDVRPVITHRFSLSDYARAFETMASPKKECGKVLLEIAP